MLFGYVGAGLPVLAALLTLMSFPVVPMWLFVVLSIFVAVTAWWSWKRYASNFIMPTLVGTVQAILWMLFVGVGVGIVGWSR